MTRSPNPRSAVELSCLTSGSSASTGRVPLGSNGRGAEDDCATRSGEASAGPRPAAAEASVELLADQGSGSPDAVAAGQRFVGAPGPLDIYQRVKAQLEQIAMAALHAIQQGHFGL